MHKSSSRLVAAAIACLAIGLLANAGVSATSPQITQTSIAGLKIGMTMRQVTAALGKPVERQVGTYDNPGQPDDYTRLASEKKKVAAYFQKGKPGAIIITTWNSAYRTAAGVGPCTSRAKAKKTYGSALEQSTHTNPGGGYVLGNLLVGFDSAPGSPAPAVTAIGLFGSKSNDFAGYVAFVTLSEENC